MVIQYAFCPLPRRRHPGLHQFKITGKKKNVSSELKYQSAQDGTTHINDPSVPESDLPSGWTEEYDEDGDLYWANLDKMLATYVPVTARPRAGWVTRLRPERASPSQP